MLDFLTKTRSLVGLAIGAVGCAFAFYFLQRALGASILDVLPHYNLDIVNARISVYGENGKWLYAFSALTLDTLFPLCYAGFSAGLVLRFLQSGRFYCSIPIALAIVDWAENIQIFIILFGYPDITEIQVAAASSATEVKHVLIRMTLLLTLAVTVFGVIKKLVITKQ